MEKGQEILNRVKDGDASAILYKLQSITEQQVEEIDYQQQIDRWNRYQEILDKIEKMCGRDTGVRLIRNVKHNFKRFTDDSSVAVGVIGVIGLLLLLAASWFDAIYWIGSLATIGLVAWQVLIRLHHPSMIHFKCSPVLHINEFAYMRQAIKAIPTVENDPVVRLPVIEMSVSRAWLLQNGMLKFMQSLSDMKLDIK
ncbi:MAG: hypothetical protein AB1351_00650 [Thermoproteota archaeon]